MSDKIDIASPDEIAAMVRSTESAKIAQFHHAIDRLKSFANHRSYCTVLMKLNQPCCCGFDEVRLLVDQLPRN